MIIINSVTFVASLPLLFSGHFDCESDYIIIVNYDVINIDEMDRSFD